MNDKLTEQAIANTAPAEAIAADSGGKGGVASFGKFSTKEGLVEAYNSLEAEFTRRSQRIKELESLVKKRDDEDKWSKKVRELTDKYPVAKELGGEISDYLENQKELLNEENCLEKALLSILASGYGASSKGTANAHIRTAPKESEPEDIYEELAAVKNALPKVPPLGGEIPVTLPRRPKTIQEAGELAIKIFKNHKE